MEAEKQANFCQIKKADDDLQVVWGEVYTPNVPDSQGDYMTAEEVRKMAYKFMGKHAMDKIDENHNNRINGSTVVESFIAREGDPLFIQDSWVVGVHVSDSDVWKRVKSGELNGFSIEALVRTEEQVVEINLPERLRGMTIQKNASDHTHEFEVAFSDSGDFIGGRTSIVQGHFHEIRSHTVTEKASTDGHAHRYSFTEAMNAPGTS
ncbi:MAG: XkdF-like putative serine protease domain-containing protein [bacterium]